MTDQPIIPATDRLTDETFDSVGNSPETVSEAAPEVSPESVPENSAEASPESTPPQEQPSHFTYEQAPPVYNQAPPMYNQVPPAYDQAPPAYTQAPPVYDQAPPAYTQAPPVYNQAPPAYTQAPPVYNQEPPAYNQAPPAYNQAPPAYTQAPPAYNQEPPAYNQATPAYNQAPPVYTQAPPVYNQEPPAYDQTSPVYNQAPPAYDQAPPAYTQAPAYNQGSPAYIPAIPAKKRSGAALAASLAMAFATVLLLASWFLPLTKYSFEGSNYYFNILDEIGGSSEGLIVAGIIAAFGVFNIICAFLNKKWAAVMGAVNSAICLSSAVYMLHNIIPQLRFNEYTTGFGAYIVLPAAALMVIFSAVNLAIVCKPTYGISRTTRGAARAGTFASVMAAISWFLPLGKIFAPGDGVYIGFNMPNMIYDSYDLLLFCVLMVICALSVAWSAGSGVWTATAGVITSVLCTLAAVWQTIIIFGNAIGYQEVDFGIFMLIPCAALALIFNILKLIFASKDKKRGRMNNVPQPAYMQ